MCYPREAEPHRRSTTQPQASTVHLLPFIMSVHLYLHFISSLFFPTQRSSSRQPHIFSWQFEILCSPQEPHKDTVKLGLYSPSPPAGLGSPCVWCDGDTPTVSSTSTRKGAKKIILRKCKERLSPRISVSETKERGLQEALILKSREKGQISPGQT